MVLQCDTFMSRVNNNSRDVSGEFELMWRVPRCWLLFGLIGCSVQRISERADADAGCTIYIGTKNKKMICLIMEDTQDGLSSE